MHQGSILQHSVRIAASLLLCGLFALTGSSQGPNGLSLRIGLRTRLSEARLQGTAPLQLRQDGRVLLEYPQNQPLVFRAKDGGMTILDAAEMTLLTTDQPLLLTLLAPPNTDAPAAVPPPLIQLLGPSRHYDGKPDRPYRGDFLIRPSRDGLTVINIVSMESYLLGVVSSEMGPNYPAEALKAQAVAARTYAVKNLGRLAAEGFDLDDTARCQVYGGYLSEDPRTTAAVIATKGQILTHERKPIDAVYSSTCGGLTESAEQAWGKAVPYLQSVSDDPNNKGTTAARPVNEEEWSAYCKTARAFHCLQPTYAKPEAFRWVKLITRQELEDGLPAAYRAGTIRKLAPLTRGASGRITELRLEGSERTVTINGEGAIRNALGKLRSSAFTVDSYPDAQGLPVVFAFWGAGWGHGIGMCQVGAVGLALQGWSYDRILQHYYRGTVLETR